jgi:Flp pilus assembly pilin Flp
MKQLLRNRKGSALVEYGLLIAGVALVAAGAVSIFGHKTNDLIAATATILPGAHEDDNGPIVSAKLIETTDPTTGPIAIDVNAIVNNTTGAPRLGNNLLGSAVNQPGGTGNLLGTLVVEAN